MLLNSDMTPVVLVPGVGGKIIVPDCVTWNLVPGPGPFPYTIFDPNDPLNLYWGSNANPFGSFFTFPILGITSGYQTKCGLFSAMIADQSNALGQSLVMTPSTMATMNAGFLLTVVPNMAGMTYAPGDVLNAFENSLAYFEVSTTGAMGAVTGLHILMPGTTELAATNKGTCYGTTTNSPTVCGTNPGGNIFSAVISMGGGGVGWMNGDTFTIDAPDTGNLAAGVCDTAVAGACTAIHLTSRGTTPGSGTIPQYLSMMGAATTATSGVGTGLLLDTVAGAGTGLTVNITIQPGDGSLEVVILYTLQ